MSRGAQNSKNRYVIVTEIAAIFHAVLHKNTLNKSSIAPIPLKKGELIGRMVVTKIAYEHRFKCS